MVVALTAAACSASETVEDGVDVGDEVVADTTIALAGRGELKPIIELAVADWTAARLNVSIAEQLIERRLGYPVEATEYVDTAKMLGDLETGKLHATLEIWPSSLDEGDRQFIASGRVEHLGELGVVGKIGWFVPRSALVADPELTSWERLKAPGVAARFATDETAPRGRFLGTDPGYEQFDEEIIDALGLPFDVVYSGSDSATAAEVQRAVDADQPIVLFWWTPTAEIMRFDLVELALPDRDPDCVAEIESGGQQRCDYPTDPLFKLAWPGLAEQEPDLHRFLSNFKLTAGDQLRMIDQVENQGLSVSVVAADWVANNSDRWENWLES